MIGLHALFMGINIFADKGFLANLHDWALWLILIYLGPAVIIGNHSLAVHDPQVLLIAWLGLAYLTFLSLSLVPFGDLTVLLLVLNGWNQVQRKLPYFLCLLLLHVGCVITLGGQGLRLGNLDLNGVVPMGEVFLEVVGVYGTGVSGLFGMEWLEIMHLCKIKNVVNVVCGNIVDFQFLWFGKAVMQLPSLF